MTHITQSQKQQIADLRAAGVSFVKIAQQTGIPKGTCKTLFYKDRPPAAPATRTKTGQFKTRHPAGRKPAGTTAQSDKARAAACRARRKAHLDSLVSNLESATDSELTTLLQSAIRGGNDKATKAIISVLHGRYAAIM